MTNRNIVLKILLCFGLLLVFNNYSNSQTTLLNVYTSSVYVSTEHRIHEGRNLTWEFNDADSTIKIDNGGDFGLKSIYYAKSMFWGDLDESGNHVHCWMIREGGTKGVCKIRFGTGRYWFDRNTYTDNMHIIVDFGEQCAGNWKVFW